jgi:xanthine dehydrogenase accessory factor
MRDLAPTVLLWLDEGHSFALAFVVKTAGSSPRPIGAAMAVREDGLIAGSVSGGCVEGAVVEAALRAIKTGRGEMLSFGSDSEAGLSCGGEIRVWVQSASPHASQWRSLFGAIQSREFASFALDFHPEKPNVKVWTGKEAEISKSDWAFTEAVPPARRLVIVGAVHIAVALVGLARKMAWETIVIDPREAFARRDRFPEPPDRLMAQWPQAALEDIRLDSDTCFVTLTHDAKIDDDALAIALKSNASYVGALGGRKTQEKRRTSLLARGVSEPELARLHGPVGLDLGAESPEEIVKVRNER